MKRTFSNVVLVINLAIINGFAVPQAKAEELLAKNNNIVLHTAAGEEYLIGTISFIAEKNSQKTSYRYTLDLHTDRFKEHFLSMRPFKCIDGAVNLVCHLPYPYENKRIVSANDLTDLEYDLLFLHKTENEYGINPWNGLYYVLSLQQGRLVGKLHEVDLNILAAPPEDGNLRPVKHSQLYESNPTTQSYPTLHVQPSH